FARRPQLQERLSKQIGDAIEASVDTLGVMVVIEAEHMCMSMRGIKKQGSTTKTIYSTGVFKKQIELRREVLDLLK
ncbi:MAG TPA: GTP cyclohydrolase I FolE, partial [Firmicutes bacterium]|nr:GTP cyclohydrolase I FolE [Bacillota bacterium]